MVYFIYFTLLTKSIYNEIILLKVENFDSHENFPNPEVLLTKNSVKIIKQKLQKLVCQIFKWRSFYQHKSLLILRFDAELKYRIYKVFSLQALIMQVCFSAFMVQWRHNPQGLALQASQTPQRQRFFLLAFFDPL